MKKEDVKILGDWDGEVIYRMKTAGEKLAEHLPTFKEIHEELCRPSFHFDEDPYEEIARENTRAAIHRNYND